MPITHQWNGTVLTITSDSGTSSADLKGAKGDDGARGPQGQAGSTIAENTQKLDGKEAKYYIQPYNLLDNSYFINPVNQRGKTNYIGAGYGMDRWESSSSRTVVNIVNGGIECYNNNPDGGEAWIQQAMPTETLSYTEEQDNIYTIAIKVNGVIYAGCKALKNTASVKTPFGVAILIYSSSKAMVYTRLIFDNTNRNNIIEWVAVYKGEYTADNLPPYIPKGYAVELAECQRYYYQSWDENTLEEAKENDRGWISLEAVSRFGCNVGITLPQTMRKRPTITVYSAQTLIEGKASSWESSFDADVVISRKTNRLFSISGDGNLTVGEHYQFYYVANADL